MIVASEVDSDDAKMTVLGQCCSKPSPLAQELESFTSMDFEFVA
jgi:hypothetical protein